MTKRNPKLENLVAWLNDLFLLTSKGRSVSAEMMNAYAKMLASDFKPAQFSPESLRYVAARCRGLPSYGELSDLIVEASMAILPTWRKKMLEDYREHCAKTVTAQGIPWRSDQYEQWWMEQNGIKRERIQ